MPNCGPDDFTKDQVFNLYQLRELNRKRMEGQKTTYCVVKLCTTRQVFRFVNMEGDHAEELMIIGLGNHFATKPTENMDIYIVNAPCGASRTAGDNARNCAEKVKEFQKEHKINISIKAVSPYFANKEELKDMIADGRIQLNAFNANDWDALRNILINEDGLNGELDEELDEDEQWQYCRKMKRRDMVTALEFQKL